MSALSGLGQQKRAFNWIFYGAVDITLHIIHKEAANIEIIFQKDKNEINRLSNAAGQRLTIHLVGQTISF